MPDHSDVLGDLYCADGPARHRAWTRCRRPWTRRVAACLVQVADCHQPSFQPCGSCAPAPSGPFANAQVEDDHRADRPLLAPAGYRRRVTGEAGGSRVPRRAPARVTTCCSSTASPPASSRRSARARPRVEVVGQMAHQRLCRLVLDQRHPHQTRVLQPRGEEAHTLDRPVQVAGLEQDFMTLHAKQWSARRPGAQGQGFDKAPRPSCSSHPCQPNHTPKRRCCLRRASCRPRMCVRAIRATARCCITESVVAVLRRWRRCHRETMPRGPVSAAAVTRSVRIDRKLRACEVPAAPRTGFE